MKCEVRKFVDSNFSLPKTVSQICCYYVFKATNQVYSVFDGVIFVRYFLDIIIKLVLTEYKSIVFKFIKDIQALVLMFTKKLS